MKNSCDKREVVETEKGLQGRILCRDIKIRSRHRKKTIMAATDSLGRNTECSGQQDSQVATWNLLKGQKSMVVTKINIYGNRNDVATWN